MEFLALPVIDSDFSMLIMLAGWLFTDTVLNYSQLIFHQVPQLRNFNSLQAQCVHHTKKHKLNVYNNLPHMTVGHDAEKIIR